MRGGMSEIADQPNAALAGTVDIGGDLTVNRLGFGAMRVTGEGELPGPDRWTLRAPEAGW